MIWTNRPLVAVPPQLAATCSYTSKIIATDVVRRLAETAHQVRMFGTFFLWDDITICLQKHQVRFRVILPAGPRSSAARHCAITGANDQPSASPRGQCREMKRCFKRLKLTSVIFITRLNVNHSQSSPQAICYWPYDSQTTRGTGRFKTREQRNGRRSGNGFDCGFLPHFLAQAIKSGDLREIKGVPTSRQSERRAIELGIPLFSLAHCPICDITVDGADEVAPNLDLIKGLGGCRCGKKSWLKTPKRW